MNRMRAEAREAQKVQESTDISCSVSAYQRSQSAPLLSTQQKAIVWHRSHSLWSIVVTTRTNAWRLKDSIRAKAHSRYLLSVLGFCHTPRYPKSMCASSPGGGSPRLTVIRGFCQASKRKQSRRWWKLALRYHHPLVMAQLMPYCCCGSCVQCLPDFVLVGKKLSKCL